MSDNEDYTGVKYLFFSKFISDLTFDRDQQLPSLPVPDLQNTLQKYLKSVEPFVSDLELHHTKKLITDFYNGSGKQLQNLLLKKASASKNWLEEWWEDYAYLKTRKPLIPYSNVAGVHPLNISGEWPISHEKALKYGAIALWHTMKFYDLVKKQHLRPQFLSKGDCLSMNQFRKFFNMTRIPKTSKDELRSQFKTEKEGTCPSHSIVLCNGRIWMMQPWDNKGNLLSVNQIEKQLQFVRDQSTSESFGIAALTLDDRDQWAMNREYLKSISKLNSAYLEYVESAVGHIALEDYEPADAHEVYWDSLCGHSVNRWCDKSYTSIVYKNGFLGSSLEHAPCDAMVSVVIGEYMYESGVMGSYEDGRTAEIPLPIELVFDVDDKILRAIEVAKETNFPIQDTVNARFYIFNQFGSQWMKNNKYHPDTFVQCAIQLAYYRLHKKVAPTYETATTRQFFNGRTETVRSCTKEMETWVKCMELSNSGVSERKMKLHEAMKVHLQLMREAQNAQGIDRHLMGLYITALENDIPIPGIFTDEAFVKSGGGGNFILSTSTVGASRTIGGVAPMLSDGYAVMYNFASATMHFSIATFKDQGTFIDSFITYLEDSLLVMQKLAEIPSSHM